MGNLRKVLLVCICLCVSQGSAGGGEGSSQSSALKGSKYFVDTSGWEEQYGFVALKRKWKTNQISVCWINLRPSDNLYAKIVRDAVKDTWEAVSSIRFVDWGKCQPSSTGIFIKIADVGPHVKTLGNNLDRYPEGMVLNFGFSNWSPDCQTERKYCIRVIAIHEFGHALGFAHEQNRPDTPKECKAEPQGTNDGAVAITKYDPDSVMNYCNPNWNGDGKLSVLDIYSVQYLYGKPPKNRSPRRF